MLLSFFLTERSDTASRYRERARTGPAARPLQAFIARGVTPAHHYRTLTRRKTPKARARHITFGFHHQTDPSRKQIYRNKTKVQAARPLRRFFCKGRDASTPRSTGTLGASTLLCFKALHDRVVTTKLTFRPPAEMTHSTEWPRRRDPCGFFFLQGA